MKKYFMNSRTSPMEFLNSILGLVFVLIMNVKISNSTTHEEAFMVASLIRQRENLLCITNPPQNTTEEERTLSMKGLTSIPCNQNVTNSLKALILHCHHDQMPFSPNFTLNNIATTIQTLCIVECTNQLRTSHDFNQLFYGQHQPTSTKYNELKKLFIFDTNIENLPSNFLCTFPNLQVLSLHKSITSKGLFNLRGKNKSCCSSLRSLILMNIDINELSPKTLPGFENLESLLVIAQRRLNFIDYSMTSHVPRLKAMIVLTTSNLIPIDISVISVENMLASMDVILLRAIITMVIHGPNKLQEMVQILNHGNGGARLTFQHYGLFALQAWSNYIFEIFLRSEKNQLMNTSIISLDPVMPKYRRYLAQEMVQSLLDPKDCVGSCLKTILQTRAVDSTSAMQQNWKWPKEPPLNEFLRVLHHQKEVEIFALLHQANRKTLNESIYCSSLRVLILADMKLVSIKSDTLVNCQHLLAIYLDYNELTSLSFRNESNNKLNAIFKSQHMPVIEYINLSKNKITKLDYSEIPQSLIQFDVSWNPITTLTDENNVANNLNLKLISLVHVPIDSLEKVVFPKSIEKIDMSESNLKSIPLRYFDNLKLFNLKYFGAAKTKTLISFESTKYLINSLLQFRYEPVSQNQSGISKCLLTKLIKQNKDDQNPFIIDCAKRQLTEIPFQTLQTIAVSVLFLDGNNFKTINLPQLFFKFQKVLHLFLNNSNIEELNGVLNHSVELLDLHLENNKIKFLQPRIFSKFCKLHSLYLQENQLTSMENIFCTSHIPLNLHLEHNQLKSLQRVNINHNDSSATSLINIHLDNNRITEINSTFLDVKTSSDLVLILHNNSIIDIGMNNFENLDSLCELYLDNNEIKVIRHRAFKGLVNLLKLFLQNNLIELLDITCFAELLSLEELHLGYNQLISLDTERFRSLAHLKVLNVEHNHIHFIEKNGIESLHVLEVLNINNNQLTEFEIGYHEEKTKLRLLYLSHNELKIFERDSSMFPYLQELHIDNNHLFSVRRNQFRNLRKLKVLKLHKNYLSTIATKSFSTLKSLEILTLHDNSLIQPRPWNYGLSSSITKLTLIGGNSLICECDYVSEFFKWSRESEWINNNTECAMPENNIVTKKLDTFLHEDCTPVIRILNVVLPVVGTVSLIVLIVILVYRYRVEMQVLLYSRYGVRFFYKQQQDEGKSFDVFVSYSSVDEAFVADELLPGLSDFRVCLHGRDFPVGAPIADTIVRAVDSSCCTLLVLSPSFLTSHWCRFEFQMAHCRALTDKCRRLIVLIYKNVELDHVGGEILAYLKTNTYLRWDDKLFWKKLLFALPEPKEHDATDNSSECLYQRSNDNIMMTR